MCAALFLQEDIEQYDFKCKVEPLQRALKETGTDGWINGRRRDHGYERATLPVWEGDKVSTPGLPAHTCGGR